MVMSASDVAFRTDSTVTPGRDQGATSVPAGRAGVMWVGVVLSALVTAWLTRKAWTSQPIAGGDVMFHLMRADVGIDDILARGRLDGWSDRVYLGTDLFLFYGPGFVWLMAAIRAISLGGLDNEAALNVVVLASFLLLPGAVAFLARSLGLSFRASAISALLTPLVSSRFGVGLEATFGVGLVTQQTGAVLWLLCLGGLIRTLTHADRRWVALTAILFAAHAVTSPVSVASLVLVGGVAAGGHLGRKSPDVAARRRVVYAGLAGIALAGFWLIPALVHSNLSGTPTYWAPIPVPELLFRIGTGRILFPPLMGLAVAGALVWITRSRHTAARFLWLTPVVYLASEVLASRLNRSNIFVASFLNHRALGLVGLVMLLPLAWAIESVGRRVGMWRVPWRHLLAFAALAAIPLAVIGPKSAALARAQSEPIPQMYQAASVLSDAVPAGARFAYVPEEGHGDRLGIQSPNLWLATQSSTGLLNATGLETTRAGRGLGVAHGVADFEPRRSSDALIELGTTHVVTTTTELAAKLEDSEFFEVIWSEDPMAVLAVLPTAHGDPKVGLTSPSPVTARVVKAGPDTRVYLVDSTETTTVDLALAWSPRWRATLNGTPVDTSPTPDWRTRLSVAPGDSVIVLQYTDDEAQRIGLIITLATALTLWRKGLTRRPRPYLPQSQSSSRAKPEGPPEVGSAIRIWASSLIRSWS